MKLGIPIYEGVNLLDVAGPLEMFYWANSTGPTRAIARNRTRSSRPCLCRRTASR
jgi:hypothetical protein